MVIIIFERPDPILSTLEMQSQKKVDQAAAISSRGIIEALHLVERFVHRDSEESRAAISERVSGILPGRIRSVDIYSKLMWFTNEVRMSYIC